MSDGPVTLSRVAREAGVSLATASRAINGSATRTVRPELRDRVMAAAQRLGYVPDPSAQAMARGRTAALGLVVHDIADPYFSAIASGVMRAAEAEGVIVTLASTQLRPERERAFVELVSRQRGRAVILAGSRVAPGAGSPDAAPDLEGTLTSFRDSGGGVATIGQPIGDLPVVEIDNAGGAAALARELDRLGYRRFAVLSGPANLRTAADRSTGFRDALTSLGRTVRDDDVVPGEFTRDGGYAAMTELIARSGKAAGGDGDGDGSLPELVFAVNDVMAVGAMAAVRDAGLRVPDDVAVAGFDDIPTLRDVVPALTTVHIALERIGEAATRLALGVPAGLDAGRGSGAGTAEGPDARPGSGAATTEGPEAEPGSGAGTAEGLESTAPGSVLVHGEVVLRASTPGR
ncbi:LacI family DNA-binding transcriptional regulator [Myceligenerans indicum]|uniref:LacI family transcriptional regulator n=1 Tax=Myceligenerans indicum TaxID=2593663 RepID=A0ABS1LRH1_9MICO|nr:LacI family DNA-binding transcriptional regulator [Myceligenerans indicum]MBL0888907.1 LacI family transcriptional regulator [Myceligenerans indicum]